MNRMGNVIHPAFVSSLAALSVAAVGLQAALNIWDIRQQKKPIAAPGGVQFHTLPSRVEGWKQLGADPPPLTGAVRESLGTDNYITRQYVQTDAAGAQEPQRVQLHAAYYTGMIDAVPHIPERCFVAGGLTLDSKAKIVPIPLDLFRFPPDPTVDPETIDEETYGVIRHGRTDRYSSAPGLHVRMPFGLEELKLRVTRYRTPNGQAVYAGYFFLANGWALYDRNQVRLLAFSPTTDYAYYAKVQFTSAMVDSAEELGELAGAFLNSMLPEIMRRVPDWVRVIEGTYPPKDQKIKSNTRPIQGTKEWEQWRQEFQGVY